MSVKVKDWDNDSDNCKSLGNHNSKYEDAVHLINVNWYKYYIYPRTKNNIRTDAFEFYPYYDSSSGPIPMSVIVGNYINSHYVFANALTYPLQYNLTKNKFLEGEGVSDYNKYEKIEELKYKRYAGIYGDCDFCPVLLTPGYVVYGNESYLDKIEYSGAGTIDIDYTNNKLSITINKGQSSEDVKPYYPSDFMDNTIPKRLLVEIQAAGGGGGGSEYMPVSPGKGGGGAGSGAYAATILNIIDYPSWRITLGAAGKGGDTWENGEDADDSTLAKWESRASTWNTVITCGGGKYGWGGKNAASSNIHRGEPGIFSDSGVDGYWLMASQDGHYGGRSAGHEGDGGHGEAGESSVAVNYNTYVNDTLKGGSSMFYPIHTSGYGDSSKKWGGGGASVFGSYGFGGKGGEAVGWEGNPGGNGGQPKCIIYLPKKI